MQKVTLRVILQAEAKEAELQQLTGRVDEARAAAAAEKRKSAALQQRMDGALAAISKLEGRVAGGKVDSAAAVADLQVSNMVFSSQSILQHSSITVVSHLPGSAQRQGHMSGRCQSLQPVC